MHSRWRRFSARNTGLNWFAQGLRQALWLLGTQGRTRWRRFTVRNTLVLDWPAQDWDKLCDFDVLKDALVETDWLVRTDVLNDCDKPRDLTVLKDALVGGRFTARNTSFWLIRSKDWDRLCDLTVLRTHLWKRTDWFVPMCSKIVINYETWLYSRKHL